MSNESKNGTVWSVIILALMMTLSASAMMFGGQVTELPNEDKVSAAAFHQDGYQIQYSMDFFSAGVWGDDNGDRIVVNDAVTSSEGVTYIVGYMLSTTWEFDDLSGSVGNVEKGFVAALTAAGAWSWVRVDNSIIGSSSLNAIDLTVDGNLIVAGTFSLETSWSNQTGGYNVLSGDSGYTSPFAFSMSASGETDWLRLLLGSTRLNASLSDVVVHYDAVYATGTSYGTMFPGELTKKAFADPSGDAYVVKFSIHDGQVSHAVDSCAENDAASAATGYCNSNAQIIPRESGEAITVAKDGSVLVGVSYDNVTTFGSSSTGEMNEASNLITPHSDIAVWKLSSGLVSSDFSTFQTNQSDMVVGIEELEIGKYYLATNANGFQGRLLEIDAELQLKQTHTATGGNLKILDIFVDSGKLELVGFGSEDIEGNKFIFEGQAYNPTNDASMFVAEYSDTGFEHGQAIDLPPTHSAEFGYPTTTSITSQDGSIRVVTVSLPLWSWSPTFGQYDNTTDKAISFGGTGTMVRPNIGIVGHFEWDTDQDGIPNRLDNYNDNIDPDHDGHANDVDNCPNDWNPQQDNNDNQDDGGDACDDDDDDDSVLDGDDSCPLISAGDLDEDGDGCPDKIQVGCTDPLANNHSIYANVDDGTCDYDWDNDGTNDTDEIVGCMDITADNYDPNATDPGQCNFTDTPSCPDCPVDGDDDGDGVPNETDQCPETPGGRPVNPDGCGEDGTIDPQGNASVWGAIGDCDPTNTSVNCQEEMIIAGVGGAGLFGGSIITRILRPGVGKGKGPRLGIGDVADAKDAYDFIAKKDGKKVKTTGGSDHYFKPGVERQGAMSTAADTALDDYVED